MEVQNLSIEGLRIIVPDVHSDPRGWFQETWNLENYAKFGIDAKFVQQNESVSSTGVFRGFHWQCGEHAQAKLVRVIRGSVIDFAIDIRKGSPTYGKWESVVLSEKNNRQFYIPRGFAHGFLALDDDTRFSYLCDNYYCPYSERGIIYNDPDIGVELPDGISVSDKDMRHPRLRDIEPCEF